MVRRTISNKTAAAWIALPVLYGAQSAKFISGEDALEDSLNAAQVALRTAIAETLNKLGVRFSAGTDRLAQLVRTDQDLTAEAGRLDKQILEAVSREPSKRDAAMEQKTRDRMAVVARERDQLQSVLTTEFPDYEALKPQALTMRDIQSLLVDDEALVVVHLAGSKSHVWALTKNRAEWRELDVSAAQVSKTVQVLRSQLDPDSQKPFDTALSFALYRQLIAPIEEVIASKPRLSFVVNGALTSLPPQVR